MRVLIVEDEVRLTEALAYLFKKNKIELDVANDGESGLVLAERPGYQVIILDIMLPGLSGLEILKMMRAKGNTTPVLLLTAKDGVSDRVKGLNLGADDYLVKPFATDELIARVHALARRTVQQYHGAGYDLGNLHYDPQNLQMEAGGEGKSLSVKEGLLLELFLKRPRQIFTKNQLIDLVWGYQSEVGENNIEVFIHNLRKKIPPEAGVEIITIRGVGYKIEERVDV